MEGPTEGSDRVPQRSLMRESDRGVQQRSQMRSSTSSPTRESNEQSNEEFTEQYKEESKGRDQRTTSRYQGAVSRSLYKESSACAAAS